VSGDYDKDLLEHLVVHLIQLAGGARGTLTLPVALIDKWMTTPANFVFDKTNPTPDTVKFEVREVPVGEPEELMGEALGLLGTFMHNDDELDRAELDRALWLLSNGRQGDPRHDEFPVVFDS